MQRVTRGVAVIGGWVILEPSRVKQREQRALTEEEISTLLTAAEGTRFAAPIRFTLASGLRQSELLALKWTDVDFDGCLAHVRGTKTAKSRRAVELSAVTITTLRTHRRQQARTRLRRGSAWQDHGLVFPSTAGTPWFKRMFYRDYRAVVDRSGIMSPATVTWHTLRHTAATQWLRHGADVFSVSRRLGHASAAFTMDVYGHLLKGQQQQAAEALDTLLAKGG
jgi:integrase